jgi:hypothetical protein
MPFISAKSEKRRGLSRIHVRATLAFVFAVGVTVGFFTDRVSEEAYLALTSMAMSFYFATRQAQEKGNNDVN